MIKVIIILFSMGIGVLIGISIHRPVYYIVPSSISLIEEDTIDEEILLHQLKLSKAQNKYIVLSQALLESNHFTSDLFKSNYNMFGMRYPGSRPTISVKDTISNYAMYTDWKESMIDYLLWQSAYARGLSEEQYYNRLKEVGFAESDVYVESLRVLVRQLKKKYEK